MPVALQCRVNLRIAETSVHFRAVEMVAALNENNALYFVRLPLVLEMHFHSLTLQVGGKHVPVAAPADLRFEDVVKLVLRPVRLFQPLTLDVILAVYHVQPVLLRKFLADAGTVQSLVPVRNGVAVVVDAVEGYMHVRMLLVEMSCDEELRVLYSHPFHVFKSDARHDAVRQAGFILFGET